MIEYVKYYHTERYLLEEVGPKFRNTGEISPSDFFLILVWKSNRAKTKHKERLDRRNGGFSGAVKGIREGLKASPNCKERMRVLIEKMEFRLPTASAISTILYPDEFTIYDIRVCDALGGFHGLANGSKFEKLWVGYEAFLAEVRRRTPADLSLRDKDRYLWGKSFYEGLQKSLETKTV